MDKNNFDYSSNNNSKVSGPLRESELLDYNRRNGAYKNYNHHEADCNNKDLFMQSQEKRLPLSKISYENSVVQPERVTNGINSTYLNGINEVPEDSNNTKNHDNDKENYNEYCEDPEEPVPAPKLSIPTPHTLNTNYKEARDQKKWKKVHCGNQLY